MSAGYASRLKEYPNKGKCGLAESQETHRSLNVKVRQLADLVRASPRIVILTGAGISTSAGIPDFRGPKGIWTLEEQKQKQTKKRKRNDNQQQQEDGVVVKEDSLMDFGKAQPTFTHYCITQLVKLKIVRYVITQNVDGLHRRSGLSRNHHCALHGCVFTETCEKCKTEYLRKFEVGGMSFQKTGRQCTLCLGDLRDTLLDWEDALPEDDYERAQEECEKADLVICCGTSLRITPVGNLPLLAKKFVIINLQETPHDDMACLRIRGRVDLVFGMLMGRLGLNPRKAIDSPPLVEMVWTPGEKESMLNDL
jgi:NAD+-dependent protein deacetylase sirtuin 6